MTTQQPGFSMSQYASSKDLFAAGATPPAEQQAAPKAAPGEPPGIQALMCVISSLHSLRDTAHFSDEEGELTNDLCTLRDWAYAQTAAFQPSPQPAPVKACVCGEPQASGTVHRVDGPCYVAAPQQEAQEPVMIYHGRCTIDCGEHGHHDVEMLRMIPAGSKLYTAPQPAPAPLSESIDQLERKLEIIGVVGVVDGHDVVRRESVLEIARRAAIAAQGGK